MVRELVLSPVLQRLRRLRRRSPRPLTASEARAALLEQASDGVFVADLSGRFTEANAAGCRLLGYKREEILGKTIMDLIRAEDVERLEREKLRMLDGKSEVSDWMLRRKDGTYVPVEVSATILPDGRWQSFVRDITPRKQLEEALRLSRERYELALRGADLGAWDWNIETGEVVYDTRWAEMHGFDLNEVAGHVDTWMATVHPEDWPHVQKRLDDYLNGRTSEYESEYRSRTKAGGWIWTLDRGRVFARNARGEPIRMVGTELDITARKRAEEERHLAEAKAIGIVSVSADAIISMEEDGRITLFNEGAEKIFGYARGEAIGAPLEILIPDRLRASHRKNVEEFASGDSPARQMGERGGPIIGRRKSGQEFPADAAISRLRIGGTTILTVAIRDLTARRRLEAEQALLSEMGSLLASTLELGPTLASIGRLTTRRLADACFLYVIDEGGEIHRIEVATRAPSLAWAGETFARIPIVRAPEIWSELEANRPVLLAPLPAERIRLSAQTDEHLRAMEALAVRSAIVVPLLAHGRLVGAMCLLSSSATRVYDGADVRFAEQIAQRAAFAIDNAQLYAHARRAIQSRDEVLGIVAHDLRNPLGAILVQAGLLRRVDDDPEQRSTRSAEAITRSAERMNRMIKDLLDMTRLEEGQLFVEQSRVATGQVVADALAAQEALATGTSIHLRNELANDLPDVWADRDRVLQIFENLIGNALKFTEAGGTVTVGAAARDREILFWVQDTGPGISAEHLPRVFDRFWQARKSERRGAGLGLPIVKGLVEAHDGRVWVESTPGRGSTFFFTFPAAPPS